MFGSPVFVTSKEHVLTLKQGFSCSNSLILHDEEIIRLRSPIMIHISLQSSIPEYMVPEVVVDHCRHPVSKQTHYLQVMLVAILGYSAPY